MHILSSTPNLPNQNILGVFSPVSQSCLTLCDLMDYRQWPPCPSPTPGVYLNSCPLSRWCHPTILSSVIPFSSCLQSFPASGSLSNVSSLHQVAKVLEFQLQHQSFQWIFRTDFLKDEVVGFPCCPRDSQESSPIPQFKSINSSALSLTTGKTIALTRWTFVGKEKNHSSLSSNS